MLWVVFQKFLVADDDNATGDRLGGFGSTSKGSLSNSVGETKN